MPEMLRRQFIIAHLPSETVSVVKLWQLIADNHPLLAGEQDYAWFQNRIGVAA
jgi:hypothetical protein